MGIDFDVDGWDADTPHWSYSGFHAFRRKVAKQVGIDLDQMYGFGGSLKKWPKDEPLVLFLNHSDCDGEMTAKECEAVAKRLKEVLAKMAGEEDQYDYDIQQGNKLVACMEACAHLKKPLVFC